METATDPDFERLLTAFAETWKPAKKTMAGLRAAEASKFAFLSQVKGSWAKWMTGNDFPDTPVHDWLLTCHNIPLVDHKMREGRKWGRNDYWAEMRWLLDSLIDEWAHDPQSMMKIGHARLAQPLKDIASHYFGYSLVPLIASDEIAELHNIALQVREPLERNKAQMRLFAFAARRKSELPAALNALPEGKKDYYKTYFGLSERGRIIHAERNGSACILT